MARAGKKPKANVPAALTQEQTMNCILAEMPVIIGVVRRLADAGVNLTSSVPGLGGFDIEIWQPHEGKPHAEVGFSVWHNGHLLTNYAEPVVSAELDDLKFDGNKGWGA